MSTPSVTNYAFQTRVSGDRQGDPIIATDAELNTKIKEAVLPLIKKGFTNIEVEFLSEIPDFKISGFSPHTQHPSIFKINKSYREALQKQISADDELVKQVSNLSYNREDGGKKVRQKRQKSEETPPSPTQKHVRRRNRKDASPYLAATQERKDLGQEERVTGKTESSDKKPFILFRPFFAAYGVFQAIVTALSLLRSAKES